NGLGGDLTVEGWVYLRSYSSYARIVDLGMGQQNDNIILEFNGSTGIPMFEVYPPGSNTSPARTLYAPSKINLNTWTHIAGVIQSNATMIIYVNGVAVATNTGSYLPPTSNRTSNLIGKSNWASDPWMDGAVTDVRIWNIARTQAEIAATMPVGSITGPVTGLMACYPMGSSGSSPVNDVSGNSLNATQNGSIQYVRELTGDLTVTGTISGSSTSLDVPQGTLRLTGNNSYGGITSISNLASLYVGNGGTAGSVGTGNVTNNGSLAFNRTDTNSFTNPISGTGQVKQIGSGMTTLTSGNTYSGGTTITSGTLALNGSGTAGSGTINNGGVLMLNSYTANSSTLTNLVSGTGSLWAVVNGSNRLTAANSYGGVTRVDSSSSGSRANFILSNSTSPALYNGTNGQIVIGNSVYVQTMASNQLGTNVSLRWNVTNGANYGYFVLMGQNQAVGNLDPGTDAARAVI
ncbi:MAG: hypothetical protein EBU36_07775, partial [Verrucomicrobia bacterium]|nr:hypothetical protein [Verrucomicrobiota bacterium]